MNPDTQRRGLPLTYLLVPALVLLALLLRIPLLLNAESLMDSDAAYNALSVKHLLQGKAVFLLYPGQDYQGITEGLLGILITKIFGWSALAYLSSSLLFYLGYVAVTFALARRAFGLRTGAMAGLLAAVSPPVLLRLSMAAVGGHMAVPLAGAVMIYCLFRYEDSRRPTWLYVLAFTAGLAYYTYKLSIVVIVPAAIYLTYRLAVACRARAFARPRVMAGFVASLLVGLAPWIAARFVAPAESHTVPLAIATPAQRAGNCRLLWQETLPDALGYAVPRRPPRRVSSRIMTVAAPRFAGTVYALALLYLVARVLRRERRLFLFPSGAVPSREATLLLFLGAPLAAYCLSNYVLDRSSVRYLLPLHAAFPVLIAFALDRWGELAARRFKVPGLAWVLAIALCLVNATGTFVLCRRSGFVSRDGLRIIRVTPPPREAVRYLLDRGVTRAWGSYWIGYLATFLTDEELIVAPYRGINERKPPDYASLVAQEPVPAYVFLGIDRQLRREFLGEMEQQGRRLTERVFPGFKNGIFVYTAE